MGRSFSLRDVIFRVYGRSGSVSVAGDLLGMYQRRLPTPPSDAKQPLRASVWDFIQLIQGRHLDLNLIKIGSDLFMPDDHADMDTAVLWAREFYRRVGIGVGKILWFAVKSADAHGLDRPGSLADLEEMATLWVVPIQGMDVFVPAFDNVHDVNDVGGLSPLGGSCAKDSKEMHGIVVSVQGPSDTPVLLAHEMGHFRGLGHREKEPYNIMFPAVIGVPFDQIGFDAGQGRTMIRHCFMHDGVAL